MASVSASWRIDKFVRRLGSTEPAPGGGSAAAVAGALGVALIVKVVKILLFRPRLLSSTKQRLKITLRILDKESARFLKLVREDAEAYKALVTAQRKGRGLLQAKVRATQAPIDICVMAVDALNFVKVVVPLAGPYLGSDLKAARVLLKGAFDAAFLMANINLQGSGPAARNLQRKCLIDLQKKMRSL